MLKRVSVVVAALALALTGCGDTEKKSDTGSGGKKTLTVFAAASLTETFTALGKTFEASHPGVTVRFNFGGSSTLAQQITQGAPADVFAAASPATMKTVVDGRLTGQPPKVFVKNRLVIAVPKDNPGKVKTLSDLSDKKLKVVLCAAQVPCGAAAEKALAAAGVKVTPVSQEQDVKAALTKIKLGEVDAGLVYRTNVKAAAAQVQGIDFAESAKAINDYPIAPLLKTRQPALAGQFVDLVLSAPGRAVLTEAGFESP